MPKLINCIETAGGMRNDFPRENILARADQLEKEGMSEKQAGRQALSEYHKELHDELNDIKKTYKIPTDKYQVFDPTEKINEINSRYEKAQSEIPVEQTVEGSGASNELISTETGGTTETIIPETTQTDGTQPPIYEPPSGQIEGELPETDQRRFTQQMMRTEDLSPENKAAIAKTLDYVVQTNAMSMQEANQILSSMNEDAAMNLVMTGEGIKPAVRVVLAQALIKKFNEAASSATDEQTKNYYHDKTIQLASFVTERLATEPGQMIQAFSLWARLSPEAQLRAAVKDAEIQGKERKRRTKKDVDKLGDKLNDANGQAAKEVTEDKDVKDAVEKTDNEKIKRAKSKIARAKTKRQNLIKKYKGSKGKNLFSSGIPGLSTEGIEFVGEVALTYIDEGVANLEILVQKIKEALKEASGKDVPEELNEQISTIADDRLNRADMRLIGEQLKSQKMKINSIIQQHFTVQDAAKKSLADKLIEEAGLEGTEAKELADKVSAAFDRIATRRKKQILFQEKARFDRVKKGLKGANTVDPKTLQGEMIRYSNLGAFNNDEFAEMIAEKLGTGKIAPEQAAKITELANKVEQAPEGSPKNDATEDLLAYRAELKGHNWAEIAQGVWYANVLSGYKTHEKNVVSTFFNAMFELAAQAVKNPKEAPFILYGLLKGLRRGGLEAVHTITTGRSPIHVKKIDTPNVLERKDFIGGAFNPANWLKFVTRLMVGEDVLQFQGLKEARAYQLASREAKKELGTRNPFSKAVWQKVDELLLNTKDRYDEALSQAKEEGLKSAIDVKRRVYELMESSRPVPMTEDAYGFAAHGTFNHEVEGTLGALTNAISQLVDTPIAGFQPLRFVVPFTRIITNVVNTGLNYTPVGYLRAARGVRGFKSFEDYGIAKKAYVKLTTEQRHELVAKASLGVGISLGLYMLSQIKGEDDEPIIEITGGGTGDYKKDQQLRDNGWQEYSLKMGDTYYSYKLTPLIFMLGFFGNMNDKEKYATNEDEATTLKQVELAAYRTGHLMSDMTWINSGGTLLGALSQPNPSGGNEIGNALEQSAKGFLIPQAYTQAAQEVENIWRLPQKQVNNMWENMVQDIPIARNKLNDKINALGDPIIRDVDVITSSETTDPVWRFLLDKGGWVAPVNKNSMVIFDGKEERAITDEEYYTFSKLRGQKIKTAIQSLIINGVTREDETEDDFTETIKKADQLTKGELQTILKKISAQATKETKEEMFNPEQTGKPKVTININEP